LITFLAGLQPQNLRGFRPSKPGSKKAATLSDYESIAAFLYDLVRNTARNLC
jgi:hypothetical protein